MGFAKGLANVLQGSIVCVGAKFRELRWLTRGSADRSRSTMGTSPAKGQRGLQCIPCAFYSRKKTKFHDKG